MPIDRIPTYPTPDGSDDYSQRLITALQNEAHQRVEDFDVLKLSNVPWVDIRVYGAKDGADCTTSMQAAMDSLTSGGVVLVPNDFEVVLTNKLTIGYSNTIIQGYGKSSKLIMHSGEAYDYGIFYATNKNNIIIRDLYLYGNKDSNSSYSPNFCPGIELDDVTDFRIENCYLENMTGGKATIFLSGGCKRGVILKNRMLTLKDSAICAYGDTGSGANELVIAYNFIKDTDSKNGIFITGGDTADDPPPINCVIIGNNIEDHDDVGIEVNGGASTAGGYGHRIIGNKCDGGHAGILVRKSRHCQVVGNWCYGSDRDEGIIIGWDSPYSNFNLVVGNSCKGNTSDGIRISGGSENVVMGNRCYDNGDYGIKEDSANSNYNIITGNNLKGNTTGGIITAGSNTECYHNITGDSVDIASASTIAIPATGEFFNITGTTNITSVTASWIGRRVTLKFAGILTFTDGSNLKLGGNFVTTADDVIPLVCDGTNWYEDGARSVN